MTLYTDKDVIRYSKGAELDTIETTWLDPAGAVRNFSTGWTFTARIGSGAGMFVEKTTGFVGAATAPNLTLTWGATDLDPVPTGSYHLEITARNTAAGTDLIRSWLFQILPGVGVIELPAVLLFPEIASSDPSKVSVSTVGTVTTLGVEKTVAETARLTANYTHPQSNTTLANVTGLSVPVAANAVYEVRLLLYYQATTVADIKIGWTGPSGIGGRWAPFGQSLSAGGLDGTVGFFNATWSTSFGLGGGGAGNDASAHSFGILTTAGTAGTLQLQAAQFTSQASDTIITAGSTLIAQRLS